CLRKLFEKEKVDEEQTLDIPTLEQMLEEVDNHNQAVQITSESPYDTKSEIKVVKSFLTSHLSELYDQAMNDYEVSADIQDNSDSDLHSMLDDKMRSVLEFETTNSVSITCCQCISNALVNQCLKLGVSHRGVVVVVIVAGVDLVVLFGAIFFNHKKI
nr:hypothetical protein [Tanacetum cinerariifolium]